MIRQGAVKAARLFLVHRHCASLGTNEPELASLACNCHSADDAIRHDSARCDVAVTCELACQRYCFAFTPRPFFHRLRNQALMSSAARNQTNTPVIRLLYACICPEQQQTNLSPCSPIRPDLDAHTRQSHNLNEWPSHILITTSGSRLLLVPARGQVLGNPPPPHDLLGITGPSIHIPVCS